MFEFIKKKIDNYKKEQETEKKHSFLFLKNHDFLEKIPNKKIERFFHYLFNNYASDIVVIEYSTTKKKLKQLNKFYNNFFSKYESITIAEDEAIVNFSCIEESFDDLVIVGKDCYSEIFLKLNAKKNGVYINGIDTDEDIENEIFLFPNIFYFLVRCIFSNKEIIIEDIYNEMISKEK